jgi:hypothetical protein
MTASINHANSRAKLEAALRVQAERPIAAEVAPESDGPTILNELITLFDGPQQREAQRLSVEASGASAD